MSPEIRSAMDITIRAITAKVSDNSITVAELAQLAHALCHISGAVDGTMRFSGYVPKAAAYAKFGASRESHES